MRWCRASVAIALASAGCAKSSTIPIAADTLMITASAAPMCGMTGAQSVAVKQAAVETIRHGYDRFIITDARYQNGVRVVGQTPVVANTMGSAFASGYGGYAPPMATPRRPIPVASRSTAAGTSKGCWLSARTSVTCM